MLSCWQWITERAHAVTIRSVSHNLWPTIHTHRHSNGAVKTTLSHRHARKGHWVWTCSAAFLPPLIGVPTIAGAWAGRFWLPSAPAVLPGQAANIVSVPEPTSIALLAFAIGLTVALKYYSSQEHAQ